MESRVDRPRCNYSNVDSSVVLGRCNFRVGGSTHRTRIVPSSLEAAVVVSFGLFFSLVAPVQTVEGFAKVVANSRSSYFGEAAESLSARLGFVGTCGSSLVRLRRTHTRRFFSSAFSKMPGNVPGSGSTGGTCIDGHLRFCRMTYHRL